MVDSAQVGVGRDTLEKLKIAEIDHGFDGHAVAEEGS
jgi:hypothetical protein